MTTNVMQNGLIAIEFNNSNLDLWLNFCFLLLLEIFFMIICLKAKLIGVATCSRHKSQGVGIPENY